MAARRTLAAPRPAHSRRSRGLRARGPPHVLAGVMIMRSIVLFVLAVAAMALGTWFVGWWTVPVVGAVWAFLAATDRTLPLQAALAGVNAWGILLALRM